MIEDYLSVIETLNQHIKLADRRINACTKTDARAELLMSMPGIGPYSAAVIVAEVAVIQPFERAKELGSFAGLVRDGSLIGKGRPHGSDHSPNGSCSNI